MRLFLASFPTAASFDELFAMADRTESPGCLVERAVNRAMRDAFAQAEAVLLARFREVSLADIAADVKRNDRRKKK